MSEPRTLVEVFRWRVELHPERPACVFLGEDGAEAEGLTYAGLDARARAFAAVLCDRGLAGERALLLFSPGLDFVVAFLGCLYAGAIPVPAYPPRPRRTPAAVLAIVRDAAPRGVITTAATLPRLQAVLGEALADAVWLAADTVDPEAANGWRAPALDPGGLAFLQYTSGSTSAPKGVRVTHASLLHNEGMISAAFAQSEESVVVSWLPLYHDMGLIGGVLQPLHCGGRTILMAPATFLQRPARWLEAISRYRATTSGGPDFGYELCVRKLGADPAADLDLSTWRVAFSGAEPVRAETLDRFAGAFACRGFRRQSFVPCYGLAEATLFVAAHAAGAMPETLAVDRPALGRNRVEECADEPRAVRLVGCGRSRLDGRIAIVEPDSRRPCGEGEVGEIWFAGPSVADGYWNRPDETARTFAARLEGTGEGPFLRTGDLGFLADGSLYVAGRRKDLVILRGRNYYPQDLEWTVERSHPALRPGCGAAFAVECEGEERLVVACEVDRHPAAAFDEMARAVRAGVAEEHELQVEDVVLLRAGTLPKTSSGKVRRAACRDAYLEGTLEVVGRSRAAEVGSPPESPSALPAEWLKLPFDEARRRLAELLAAQAARYARVAPEQVGAGTPLGRLGLDSLAALEWKQALEDALGVSLPLSVLSDAGPADELAAEVLARLAGAARQEGPESVPRAAGETAGEHPMSYGQRAFWFLDRLEPASRDSSIAAAGRLAGRLDGTALVGALSALAARHPALRTTFVERDEPVQRVGERLEPELQEIDAEGWTAAELRQRLVAEADRPFDLGRGPLLRLTLFTGAGSTALLLAVHHIVCDLWSLEVMVRELGAFYEERTGGVAAALPPLALRYSDFARWQIARLAGAEGERLWEYWRRRLEPLPPLLEPATDRPRGATGHAPRATRRLWLDAEAAAGARRLTRDSGTTLATVLAAAFAAVLARRSGQEDLLLGLLAASRERSELAGLVGYFANPLPLRVRVAGREGFARLLGEVRSDVLGAFDHQDYPLPLLAERLHPRRQPDRSPLLPALFTFQQARDPQAAGLAGFALGWQGARMQLGGLGMESIALEPSGGRFDLSLMAAEIDGGIGASLQFDAGLFDGATADRVLLCWRSVLAAAVGDPARPLAGLDLLTPEERHQVVVEWNDTATGPAPWSPVPAMVAAQAARTPDAVAVSRGEQSLSYGELERRARRLAARLRRLGVGPEVFVGICAERSLATIVACLGALAAGGAFVPLDPDYPAERLRLMLEDSGVAVLLGERAAGRRLPAGKARQVWLDERTDEPSPASGRAAEIDPESLAYVIYTSGSTGRPKGVGIPQRALVNLLESMRRRPGLRAGDRLLAATSLSFDVAVLEVFLPLVVGARIELASREEATDGGLLADLVRRSAATVLPATPTTARMLVDAGWEGKGGLALWCAGEALAPTLAAALCARSPAVWNVYGPTEAAVYSLLQPVRAGEPVRIGRSIDNAGCALVGPDLEPLPLGVPGELILHGRGLARGYWRRPELTAERFMPLPFGDEPGARAYRTGDLARWRPDGTVEYLGRSDQQVKVRGHRIEPGEVEEALAQHPGIRQAVIGVRPDACGQAELVAWLVARDGAILAEQELQSYLRERLPAAFVPSRWVFLASLPLTPSGKVDRGALPAPAARRGGASEVPRGAVEQVLAEIWREILAVEAVGREDDFFALGGHSLLATRLVARVRQALGVDLTVRGLLESPRLADSARRIEALRRAGAAAAPAIARGGWTESGGLAPLSFAQEQLWLFEQLVPGTPVYHLAAGLRLLGPLAVPAMAGALELLVERHEVLRTLFVAVEGRPRQRIEPAGRRVLPLVDLSGLGAGERDAEQSRWMQEEARRPFDLGRGPLLRTLLFRTGPAAHRLLVVQHHAVSDAWSVEVLVRELGSAYAALARGERPALPTLPVQYRDYARWQREWLRGAALERQAAYWRDRLESAPDVLELPWDRPRAALPSFRGGRRGADLPRELAAGVRDFARRCQATPFMVLLAAFQVLLGRAAGQRDLNVGVPFSGRGRAETQPLLGFFVNTLVLRADLAGEPGFRELVARARESVLAAHDHADLPFELVVEALQPRRDVSRHPLFQVLFNLIDRLPSPELPGLQVEVEEIRVGRTKFDLTLTAERRDDDVRLWLDYARNLCEAATAARWLSHLEELLRGAIAQPDCPLGTLPLLAAAERWQLVGEWAQGQGEPTAERCVHELFEEWVRRTPDAPAVVCEPAWLSYRELDERAGRFAARLRRLGTGPESRVGLSVEPSLEMLIALLGILKAGGAYVPLSAQFPPDRQLLILEDSGARLLVTERSRLAAHAGFGGRVLLVDDEPPAIMPAAGPAAGTAAGRPVPGNAAYVIYTSGSTGSPKGVVVEHRQVVEYVRGVGQRLELRAGAAAALVQPIAVDASKTLLFGGLAGGCCLHLISAEQATDAAALGDYFARHAIELLKISPSHLAALHGAAVRPRNLMPLDWLMLGGEASRRDWVEGLQAAAPGCTIFNHYGPTEATVGVLTYRVTGNRERMTSARVPMGYPLPNCAAYLLDEDLEPVGIGAAGQLYIGGRYLARGYLDRPDLTAAVFWPDPFSTLPGARVYRTGDLARRSADGALEFLGRVDKQLKVRGFRIEPGEVEAALGRHPGVREVVASDWTDRSGNRRLAAYWIAEPGGGVDAAELRRFLRERIPEFMIPAAFVRLEDLPRLPHGKVDLKALPEPVLESRDRAPAPPANAVEEQLARVWSEVLGVERVGTHDNFFELGGDSILSIQIVARAKRLGLRLAPGQLFQRQTIAELAPVVGVAGPDGAEQGAVEGPVPLTPIQAAFFEQDLTDPHHFNQAVLLEMKRGVEPAFLARALAALMAHHDALRHRFTRAGDSWSQCAVAAESARLLTVVDLAGVPAVADAAPPAAGELQASLDLEHGPLLRAALFRHGAGRPDRLLVAIHHLVVDAVSWRILLEDLALACEQQARGREPALPSKTTSYKRWAEELTREARSPAVAGEVAFWLDERLPDPPLLPVDFCRGENTAASARAVVASLGEEETARLLHEAPRTLEARLDEILLAALAASLRAWTGRGLVLVDLEAHGREEVAGDLDVTRTVGWFTAVFPLGVDLGDAQGPAEVVRRVSGRQGKLPRRGLSYGLARFLGADVAAADALRHFHPEVKLNYLGQLDQGVPVSGLYRLLPEPAGATRSPRGRRSHVFDLTAAVAAGRFRLEWTYSSALHEESTVRGLAASFCDFLRAVLAEKAPAYPVAAELASLGLRQADLDAVLSEFEFEEE